MPGRWSFAQQQQIQESNSGTAEPPSATAGDFLVSQFLGGQPEEGWAIEKGMTM
jgi:hypothetical protein